MAQERLAYAGVVELPQEVCQLPWTDEETLEQENIACDPPTEEENGEERLSVSDSVPIPNMSEVDANDMNRHNHGNAHVEVKTTSGFNSGPDIAICFFHAEANDQEDMDPDNHDEHQEKTWLEHGTESTEHAVGIDQDATSVKSSSTLPEQQGETVPGNILESRSDLSFALW